MLLSKNKHRFSLSFHNRAGFTLLEVMITLIILAIGLLGLAGMQMIGMCSTKGAMNRSQAMLLANDIIERMRAHPDRGVFYDDIDSSIHPKKPDCALIDCTYAQLAAYDIHSWGEYYVGDDGDGSKPEAFAKNPRGTVKRNLNGSYTLDLSWDSCETYVNDIQSVVGAKKVNDHRRSLVLNFLL